MATSNSPLFKHSVPVSDGFHRVELSVPDIHCGGCIQKVETALSALEGIRSARVNLSQKRVSVIWGNQKDEPRIISALGKLGLDARFLDSTNTKQDKTLTRLILAMSVSGFCAINIMMLSLAVWSGAEGNAKYLFHWISAALSLPALWFGGRIFFKSAWKAASNRQCNMDVPISIGLIITFAMSFYDTVFQGEHVYFDAATSLLFFLLIGRILDHAARNRTKSAIDELEKLFPENANVITAGGQAEITGLDEIVVGSKIILRPGERVPLDGVVLSGNSALDLSVVSGEAKPQSISPGLVIPAGAINLSGKVIYETTKRSSESFLARMTRLIERAEDNKGKYRKLADKIASYYSPVVHLAAALAFVLWFIISADLYRSLTIAVSVLIITCPCALALAVPMVQINATRCLFKHGILVKDGSVLERIPTISKIVFDKTGTLTLGEGKLLNQNSITKDHLMLARSIASHSLHPYSVAIYKASTKAADIQFDEVSESVGNGLAAKFGQNIYKLGKRSWALNEKETDHVFQGPVLTQNGVLLAEFQIGDQMTSETIQTVKMLTHDNYNLGILSGDNEDNVSKVAEKLGIEEFYANSTPESKLAYLEDMSRAGNQVMMIGDGMNDAPALSFAPVSVATCNATDVGRNAADILLLNDGISDLLRLNEIARKALSLMKQNIGLAILYNISVIPLAFMGLVTPLIAAIAMSSSSLLVVGNALRLNMKTVG